MADKENLESSNLNSNSKNSENNFTEIKLRKTKVKDSKKDVKVFSQKESQIQDSSQIFSRPLDMNLPNTQETTVWYKDKFKVIAGILTIVWTLIAAEYLVDTGWWENRFEMSPPEFVGFISGMFLPIVMIWLLVAYFERGARFERESQMLRAYMNQLVYPTDDGAVYTKALTDALRTNVQELRQVFGTVTSNTELIKDELSKRIAEMAQVAAKVDGETLFAVRELANNVENVLKMADNSSVRAKEASDALATQVLALADVSEATSQKAALFGANIAEKIADVEAISSKIQEQGTEIAVLFKDSGSYLARAGETARNQVEYTVELIHNKIDEMNGSSDAVIQNAQNMANKIALKIKELQELFLTHEQELISRTARLDEQTIDITNSFREQSAVLDKESEKVATRIKIIEEDIALHTQDITASAEDSIAKLNQVSSVMLNNTEMLTTAANKAASSIEENAQSFTKAIDHVSSSAEIVNGKTGIFVEAMERTCKEMYQMAEALCEKIVEVSDLANNSVNGLQNSFESVVTKSESLIASVQEESGKLEDLSSVVVSQTRIAESALAQQQRHISSSAARIEEIKGELRKEVEDLTSAAAVIDESAAKSVMKLRANMEDLLDLSETVINRTTEVSDAISNGTNNLDESSSKALNVVNQVAEILQAQGGEMSELGSKLQERTKLIGDAMQKQTEITARASAELVGCVEKTAKELELQASLIDSMVNNAASKVRETSQSLEDRIKNFDDIYRRQEGFIEESSEKILEQFNHIGGVIKNHATALEQDVEKIVSRVDVIEKSLEVQTAELSKVYDDSVNKIDQAGQIMEEHSAALSRSADNVTMKVVQAAEAMNKVAEDLTGVIKITGMEAKQTKDMIDDSLLTINNAGEVLINQTRQVGEILNDHVEIMQGGIERTAQQVDVIKEALAHQVEDLSDVVNMVATQSRLGEASLGQQTRILSETSEDIMNRIHSINDAIRKNSNELLTTTSRVVGEFEIVSEKIAENREKTTELAAQSVESSTTAVKIIEEKAILVNRMVDTMVAKIAEIGDVVLKQYEQITSTSDITNDQLRDNASFVAAQAHQLERVSDEAQRAVKAFGNALRDRSVDFSKVAEDSMQNVQKVSDALNDIGHELEQLANKSLAQVEVSGERVRSTMGEVAANSERMAGEVRLAGESFLKQTSNMSDAAAEAMGKLSSLLELIKRNSEELHGTSDKIASDSLKLGGAIKQQIQALSSASKSAEEQIVVLDKKQADASTDRFIKDTGFIIERLQSFAVDITRIFQPDVEEELWKKYYEGDKSAFSRYLARVLDKQKVAAIRSKFEKDPEFRGYVTRYIAEFDTILGRAKANERSGIMTAILIGSDIGRVYMILSRTLNAN